LAIKYRSHRLRRSALRCGVVRERAAPSLWPHPVRHRRGPLSGELHVPARNEHARTYGTSAGARVIGAYRSLVDRANDWLRENNDVEVKSCETVTWLSHDAASLSAGSEMMVLSKPVAPPVVNTHCYRGLRYENEQFIHRSTPIINYTV